MAQGYRHVHIQLATPGFSGYGVSGAETSAEVQRLRPEGTPPSPVFEPTPYVNTVIKIDEKVAAKFPYKTPGGSRGNDCRLDGTIVRP